MRSIVQAQYSDADKNGQGSIILKELQIEGARAYYKSRSEVFIPTTLWEETRHLENQIFDALPADHLADMMHQYEYFTNDSKFRVFSERSSERHFLIFTPVSIQANLFSYKSVKGNNN